MLKHTRRFRLPHTLLACVLMIVLAATGLADAQGQNVDGQAPLADEATAEIAQPADAQTEQDGADEPADDEAARAMRQIGTVSWEDVPFEVALSDLEQQLGLEITFDPVIQDAIDELDPKPHISLALAKVPMEQALKLALDQLFDNRLRDALPPVGTAWSLEDGALHLGLQSRELRVYDIRDLSTPLQPDMTQAPWTDEKIAEVREAYIHQLADLIKTSTGDPRHWSGDYADTVYNGSIRVDNDMLLVAVTTPTNHRAILSLLGRLRTTRGIQVSFECRYLLLDTETFTEVFSEDIQIPEWWAEEFQALAPERRGRHTLPHDEATVDGQTVHHHAVSGIIGLTQVTQQQQQDLLDRVAASNGIDMYFGSNNSRITMFNGQRGFFMAAQQISFISGLNPIVDSDKLDPTLAVSQIGWLFAARGSASAGRTFVTAEIDFEASAMLGMPLVLPHGGDIDTGFIEVPQMDRIAMRATLSMPDGAWLLLVGPQLQGNGISTDADTKEDPAQPTDTRRVVLLIKPTIIERAGIEIDEVATEAEAFGE